MYAIFNWIIEQAMYGFEITIAMLIFTAVSCVAVFVMALIGITIAFFVKEVIGGKEV